MLDYLRLRHHSRSLYLPACKQAATLSLLLPRRCSGRGEQDRLMGASRLLFLSGDYEQSFDRVTELVSRYILEEEASAGREEAIRFCLQLRNQLEENGGQAVNGSLRNELIEWVQRSSRNAEEVEAMFTLLLLMEAHELYAQQSFAQALSLLLEGRQTPHPPGAHMSVSYSQFLASWRSRSFLPVRRKGGES